MSPLSPFGPCGPAGSCPALKSFASSDRSVTSPLLMLFTSLPVSELFLMSLPVSDEFLTFLPVTVIAA